MAGQIEKDKAGQNRRLKEKMLGIRYKLTVISGKGGVGKTTVSVNLAYGLVAKGYKVGILDVDIHGPNVAKMLGIENERLRGSEFLIEPVEIMAGLKAVSLALAMENKDQPIIWRGPLKMITIKQFLSDVNWGELDYLIIDSPPGTGDEPLSVCQLIPDMNGAIVVTTPQDVAVLDARKTVLFARQLNIPFVGIIENMSGFLCPHCNKEIDLFGSGGGEKAAGDFNIPFLGRIPIEPGIVKSGDSGEPYLHYKNNSRIAVNIREIVEKIDRLVKEYASEKSL